MNNNEKVFIQNCLNKELIAITDMQSKVDVRLEHYKRRKKELAENYQQCIDCINTMSEIKEDKKE